MSQWGVEKRVNSSVFICLVDSHTGNIFEPLSPKQIIADIYLLSGNEDLEDVQQLLISLKKKYVAQPYSLWLSGRWTNNV